MTNTRFLSAFAVLACLVPASASFAQDAMATHPMKTSAMAANTTNCQAGQRANCDHRAASGAMGGGAMATHATGAMDHSAMSGGAMADDHMKPHK